MPQRDEAAGGKARVDGEDVGSDDIPAHRACCEDEDETKKHGGETEGARGEGLRKLIGGNLYPLAGSHENICLFTKP